MPQIPLIILLTILSLIFIIPLALHSSKNMIKFIEQEPKNKDIQLIIGAIIRFIICIIIVIILLVLIALNR